MKNILLVLLLLSVFTACQNNKLKTNEKKLAQEILSEEETLAHEETLRLEEAKLLADSIAKLPKGFRFKEDRTIDLNNPPEVIDIAGNLENRKEIRLSDIGKKIRYIRLESPSDSLFHYRAPKVRFTKTNIIATSQLATCIYSLSGEYIDMICKSELKESLGRTPPLPPIPYFNKYHNIPLQLKNTRNNFSRNQNKGISKIYENAFSGEIVYFKFRDRQNKKSYLMKFDVSKDAGTLILPGNFEATKEIKSKGEIIAPFKEKSTFNYHILDKNIKIGYQSKWNSTCNGIMLLLQNMQGDTLCVFNETERITNYDATVIRSVESGSKYFFRNQFTYRSAFNDTVFRLIPPNRLLPVFIINFGKYKTSALEALHPKYSLEDKFIVDNWVETPQNIFIRYTENRVSINNLRHKTVKFHYACYDKSQKRTSHFAVNSLNYVFQIENDIDGGLPLWTEQTKPDGSIYMSFEGWQLKRHVKSNQFKQSDVPLEKKEKLLRLAEAVGDAETLIMVIE